MEPDLAARCAGPACCLRRSSQQPAASSQQPAASSQHAAADRSQQTDHSNRSRVPVPLEIPLSSAARSWLSFRASRRQTKPRAGGSRRDRSSRAAWQHRHRIVKSVLRSAIEASSARSSGSDNQQGQDHLQECKAAWAAPQHELGVDRENTRGNLHFLSAFRARKVPLLVGSRRTSCASGGRWPHLCHRPRRPLRPALEPLAVFAVVDELCACVSHPVPPIPLANVAQHGV